jgi:hypothetical protein
VSFVDGVHSVLLINLTSASLVILTGQSISWDQTASSFRFLYLGCFFPFLLSFLYLRHQLLVLFLQLFISLLLLR